MVIHGSKLVSLLIGIGSKEQSQLFHVLQLRQIRLFASSTQDQDLLLPIL